MMVAELSPALPLAAARSEDRAADRAPAAWGAAPELAIVIPTLNERDNVPIVVERLNRVLAGIAWEAIFVDDDSPDGTADVVRALARRQPNIRVLQRLGRRGLSSACIDGILASAAPYAAVMDGDLQHDENLLPVMLAKIKAAKPDVILSSVVGDSNVAFYPELRKAGIRPLDEARQRITPILQQEKKVAVARRRMASVAAAIRSGLCRAVLCVTGEASDVDTFYTPRARRPTQQLPYREFEVPYGPMGVNSGYGQIAMRHMHEYGTTSRQLAKIAVDQRANACANPDALFYGQPLTIGDVLASPLIVDPLHLL